MKTGKKILIAIISVVIIVGSFLGGYFVRNLTDPDLVSLKFIIDEYKKHYLEERDDYLSIMGNSILDRYSAYYTAEEYELINKVSSGSRAGAGLQISGLIIVGVIGNSPAERAGITVGGKIKAIKKPAEADYTLIATLDEFSDALSKIDAKVEFSLKIEYDGEDKEFSLQKEEYRETYVYYSDESGSYRFGGTDKIEFNKYSATPLADFGSKTGYIKYTSFYGTASDISGSAKQMEIVLEKFKNSNRENLIFDLRGNGGGFLDIACDIASHFISGENGSKKTVAISEDKYGTQIAYNSAKIDYENYGFKRIIFLADENSASASEALMGAVLSYDTDNIVTVVLARSMLNGEYVYKTYGKGIMQTTYENLGKGDAIRLTTAYIKWPNGVCIHGQGITKTLLGDKCVEAEYGEGDYALNCAIKIINGEV